MRPKSKIFQRVYGLDFDFFKFCSVKSSNIFTVFIIRPEKTFKLGR